VAKAIRGLGEIALRVSDLAGMTKFYQGVIGLELMGRFDAATFFKLAEGFGGHTQVFVLFDRSAQQGYQGLDSRRSTVDHIAFEIALADLQGEKERLEAAGVQVTTAEHLWVRWRSLYVIDPEGNEVEFVCYDESLGR